MIPRTRIQDTHWRDALRDAITDPEELLEILQLPRSRWLTGALHSARLFPLKVPRGYVDRMQPGNADDPLLMQVLPLALEMDEIDGYSTDPVGDVAATCNPGLIQKYHGRSLLITTGACAIHCRYCFRRHFPYSNSHAGGSHLASILTHLQNDESVEEVILSGGDPLMLDDDALSDLLQALSAIPHIQRIRLHTRIPVVLPERITPELTTILATIRKMIVLVIHANHPQEFDESVQSALSHLQAADVLLYNQSVLLKGINDDPEIQYQLAKTLIHYAVQPYYLHLLDKVQGAAHFDVDEATAKAIYRDMQSRLPGYLLPRLVREIPGTSAKSIICI